MLGYEEIISNEPRVCKAKTVEKTSLLLLPHSKFMDFFAKELKKDKETKEAAFSSPAFSFLDRTDFDELKAHYEECEFIKYKKSMAVLKALKLNPIEIQGREIHNEDRVLNKFKYVFRRAKRHMCLGNDEIRHRDRVNVIKNK
jgi:hypothetical protein